MDLARRQARGEAAITKHPLPSFRKNEGGDEAPPFTFDRLTRRPQRPALYVRTTGTSTGSFSGSSTPRSNLNPSRGRGLWPNRGSAYVNRYGKGLGPKKTRESAVNVGGPFSRGTAWPDPIRHPDRPVPRRRPSGSNAPSAFPRRRKSAATRRFRRPAPRRTGRPRG